MPRLADLAPPPGAFAAVMATGIVSIAAGEHGLPVLSAALAGVAVAALVTLAGLVAVRLVYGLPPVAGRLSDPSALLPLFGAVAACAVLAARYAAESTAVELLGAVGLACWLVLASLTVLAGWRHGPAGLRGRVRGAWLLPAVATAGLVITAADLTGTRSWVLVPAVAGWVLSLALYAGAVALIGARALADGAIGHLLAGDSWIVMGGLAIGTLAGDRLLRAAPGAHAAGWIDPDVRPGTAACWLLATALVPVLAVAHARRLRQQVDRSRAAETGRHGAAETVSHGPAQTGRHAAAETVGRRPVQSVRRRPRHNVLWWAAVFPLGMYAVATRATADRFGWRLLAGLSAVFFWIALAAWALSAAALLHAGAERVFGPPTDR